MREKISKKVKEVKDDIIQHTWVERASRIGYVVRGAIYFLMGLFGFQLALGLRGNANNFTDIIIHVSEQPFGKILLAIIFTGLIGYAFWNLLRSVFNVINKKNDFMGIASRIGYFVSSVSYGTIAYATLQIINGSSVAGNSSDPSAMGEKIIKFPYGREIFIVVGLCWFFGALAQAVFALRSGFKKELKVSEMGHKSKKWGMKLGKAGLIGRSFLFALIGGFIVKAAYDWNVSEAYGIGGVFGFLKNLTFGPIFVGLLSMGIMAFGGFSIFSAKYVKFPKE